MKTPLHFLVVALAAGTFLLGASSLARAAGFTVLTQFPLTDGTVNAVVADAVPGVVYIGGNFTTVGGQARSNLAAINAATGAVLPWNPGANGIVYTLLLSNGALYVGGNFSTLAGITRNGVGALANVADLSSSSVVITAFDPNATGGNVSALVTDGTFIYASGLFSAIGGQSYQGLAKLTLPLGTAVVGWNPNPMANGNGVGPGTLAVTGTTLYAGGIFTSIGGLARKSLAAIDTATGAVTAFDPSPTDTNFGNQSVTLVRVQGNRLYVAGNFDTIAGQARANFAALLLADGSLDATFSPDANGAPSTIAFDGEVLYAGGNFTTIGGDARAHLAALDANTGFATGWNPGANNLVQSLAILGGVVYLGADSNCMTIGGVTHPVYAFAAVTENAPNPVPPSAPVVKISGKKSIPTTKSTLTIKGSASVVDGSVVAVKVKVGKATAKTARGTGSWRFKAKLNPGRNVVLVTATGSNGLTSKSEKITIVRQ